MKVGLNMCKLCGLVLHNLIIYVGRMANYVYMLVFECWNKSDHIVPFP